MRWLRVTLFIATLIGITCLVAIWVRSYSRTDVVNFTHIWANPRLAHQELFVVSGRGSITIGWFRDSSRALPPGWASGFRHVSADPSDAGDFAAWPPGGAGQSLGGLGTYSLHDGFNKDDSVNFPLWLPTLALVVACAFEVLMIVRSARRSTLGHCPRCGYDLRASKDRCPECGQEIQSRGHAGNPK